MMTTEQSCSKNYVTSFYFFSLGLWMALPTMAVMYSATEDVLAGTSMSTAVLLIAYSIFDIASRVLSPMIVSRISFRSSMVTCTVMMIGSLLLIVVISENVILRIAGVASLGFGTGVGAITCLRMLAYYERAGELAGVYTIGINCGACLGSVGYTAMTTWLCVAPRAVVAGLIPMCLLPLVFYALLDKKPLNTRLHTQTTTRVQYTRLEENTDEYDANPKTPNKVTHELLVIFKAFLFISSVYVNNVSLHLSMTAVLTTVTYPSAPFPPRDHYQYYRLASDVGLALACLGSLSDSCVISKCGAKFQTHKIVNLVSLNVGHLILFVFESWYHFLSNAIVILLLALSQGIVFGSVYIRCFAGCGDIPFNNASDKGTALGWVTVGHSVGRIFAGLLGLFIEKYLRDNCTSRLLLGRFCLARHSSVADWNTNLHCNLYK